ncbi:FecR family protein [Dyadobacter sp. SG02]|uniref:FecR family protein n=1 Tax=Dyadobacter sp. SG02 TaxID=1855291 RepID=UPI0008B375F1|nr:FecR family protein [Dyadobacter sp. SG02]SEI55278.1 FecR family protein [Dyadobacter sp. SG02]
MDNTYEHFGTVDFVTDDRFLQHQLAPSADSAAFWEAYLRIYPHKNPEWQQAAELLNAVLIGLTSYSRTYLSEEEEARLLDRILRTTEAHDGTHTHAPVKPLRPDTVWYRRSASAVAAVVALAVIATGYLIWRPQNTPKAYYAETISALENTSKVTRHTNKSAEPELYYLPDSSSVMLAPHSEVSFTSAYNQDNRSVYLSGKATLDVLPNAGKPFYVYANEVVTKVLGTKFEVVAFDDGSDVTVKVLNGKVTVYQNNVRNNGANAAPKQSAVLLLPNQLVVFDRKAELFDKRLVENPVSLPGVKSLPRFEYEDGYAVRFFEDIKKAYGVNVVYNPELLENCQFSASFSDESLPEKLDVVCKTIGASYEIIDAQVVITTTGCKP